LKAYAEKIIDIEDLY
jgi:Rad3-related DNA helicase